MKRWNWWSGLTGLGLVVAGLGSPMAAWANPTTVVVVTDGPVPDARVTPFVDALREVAGSQHAIADDVPVVAGDWTREGVEAAFEEAYATQPDLVLALGTGASTVALSGGDAAVPTVAPWVLDPVLQGWTGEAPANVHPVRVHLGLQGLAQTLREVGGVQEIAILADPMGVALLNVTDPPDGLDVVTLTDGGGGWLGNLDDGVQGVIVGPLGRFETADRQAIAAELIDRGLPSLTLSGVEALNEGFMMSRAGLGDLTPLARSTALLSVGVLEGRAGSDAAWTPANTGAIALQMETVMALGLAIPFDVLTNATLVGDASTAAATEAFEDTVALALQQSPSLRASRAEVDAANSDLIRSWSTWLPQVGVSAGATFLDERVSQATLGQQPTSAVAIEGVARQLIYDVRARAAVPVQQRLQAGRVAGFEARTLDVVNDVMVAYIDAIRAQALLDVRESDLQSLQAHLEAARVRVAVGDATDAEVARWTAEIAQARAALVDGYVRRRIAHMRLNQVVGRDPGLPFAPDAAFADRMLGDFSDSVVGRSVNDPVGLQRLGGALVTLGLNRSPELAQIDLGIEAQEVWLGATKRTYYVPTVGAQFSGTYNAWRASSGGGLDLSGLPAGAELGLPEMPNAYAAGGVTATFPLFEGRARLADQAEAAYELEEIRSTRLAVEQALTLRIRSAVLSLEGRIQRVKMAEIAMQGAARNLDWAQDAYGRGLATQLQLLDARSEVLQSRLAWTDARFEQMAAIVELGRAIAVLSYPDSPADPAAIEQELTELLSGESP